MHELRWLAVYFFGGLLGAVLLGMLGAPPWGMALGAWLMGDSLANDWIGERSQGREMRR